MFLSHTLFHSSPGPRSTWFCKYRLIPNLWEETEPQSICLPAGSCSQLRQQLTISCKWQRSGWGSFLRERVMEASKNNAGNPVFAEAHKVQSPLREPSLLSRSNKPLFPAILGDDSSVTSSGLPPWRAKQETGPPATALRSDWLRRRIRRAWCRTAAGIPGSGKCVKSPSKVKPKLGESQSDTIGS